MAFRLRRAVAVGLTLTALWGARPAVAAATVTADQDLVWPGSIATIERQLADPDVEVRRAAALDLSRLPTAVQRRLLPRAFADTDAEVRLAVADAALAIRLPEAGALVVKWLNDPDSRVREAAAEVLAVLRHPSSVAGLGRILEDPEAAVRVAAARALGNSEAPEASSFLLGHLDDTDPEVRRAVIAALEDLGDRRAVVPLIGRIQEQRAALRRQAAAALGTLGDKRAASALIVALTDADASVRAAAASSLGQLHAEDAVWPLGLLLETEVDREVRAAAIGALGAIGSPSSVDALLAAAHRSRESRAHVERALARAGERALESLERCVLQPAEGGVAETCAAALGAIGGSRSAELLERALRQGVVPATAALVALGRAGGPSTLPTVLEYLASAVPSERRAAIDAAGRLLEPSQRLGLAVEPIVAALERARGKRQEQAALIGLLGRTGSARAAASLRPFATGSDEYLRSTAIEAIGQLDAAGADDVLLGALASQSFATRWTAAVALRRVGTPSSARPLLDALEVAPERQRELIAVALAGPLASPEAARHLPALSRAIETGPGPLKDALLESLAHVPGEAGTASLRQLIALAAPPTRAKLAEVLAARSDGVRVLSDLARDPQPAVRANALWALGVVGGSESMDLVQRAADDTDIAVAANAVAAVARIAGRAAADVSSFLCRELSDPRGYVRANALAGLRATDATCREPPEYGPAWLLEHHPAEEVRMAAARLLRDGPQWRASGQRALLRCAARDVSGRVATECARAAVPPNAPAVSRAVAVLVVPPGSAEPAPGAPYSLVHPDGFIRSGITDRRGSVWEASTARGALRLTLPAVYAD